MPPGPGPNTPDLRDERLVVGLIIALVTTGLVVAQAAFYGPLSGGSAPMHLLQGPAVAIYGLVLSVCIDERRGIVPGALFVVVGASQPAWLLGTLVGLGALGLQRSTIPDTLWQALPFVLTGLAFVPLVWLATRCWWAPTLSLAATGLAGWGTGVGPAFVLGLPSEALALTMLHLGVCWPLAAALFARTWRLMPHTNSHAARPTHCPTCGYPREGLTTSICPECGGNLD